MRKRQRRKLVIRNLKMFVFPMLILMCAIVFLHMGRVDVVVIYNEQNQPYSVSTQYDKNSETVSLLKKQKGIDLISEYTRAQMQIGESENNKEDISVVGVKGEYLKSNLEWGNIYAPNSMKCVVSKALTKKLASNMGDSKSKTLAPEEWIGKQIILENPSNKQFYYVHIVGIINDKVDEGDLFVSNEVLRQMNCNSGSIGTNEVTNMKENSEIVIEYLVQFHNYDSYCSTMSTLQQQNVEFVEQNTMTEDWALRRQKGIYESLVGGILMGVGMALTIWIMRKEMRMKSQVNEYRLIGYSIKEIHTCYHEIGEMIAFLCILEVVLLRFIIA